MNPKIFLLSTLPACISASLLSSSPMSADRSPTHPLDSAPDSLFDSTTADITPNILGTPFSPHSPFSPLHLTLHESPRPLHLTFTLRNTGATPITLLIWETPLDSSAVDLGIFDIYTDTGDLVQLPVRTVRRPRPSKWDWETVEAGGVVEGDVDLDREGVREALRGAKGAMVGAVGRWKGFVGEAGGQEEVDVKQGGFRAEKVRLVLY